MTSPLVIFRPEPGASITAERAEQAGWRTIRLPLFTITALDWNPPDPSQFDAILMTSANSARTGRAALAPYRQLPLYAVGAQTAEAARAIGFEAIIAGEGGAADMADRLRSDGKVRIFHPAGEATRPFDERGLEVVRVAAYTAERIAPPDLGKIPPNSVLLVHSPRAALYLDELCSAQAIARENLNLVAISPAALERAGRGWKAAAAARRPSDAAMLEATASLADRR